LNIDIPAPNFVQQKPVGEHFARVRHEQPQDIIFARREFYLLATHRHDPAHEIDRKIAAAKDCLLALLLKPVARRERGR
jgi:hypothetical protein